MSKIKNGDHLTPTVYVSGSRFVALSVEQTENGVWATSQNIADIFDVTRQNIELHISNIYKDEELDKNRTCKEYLQVRMEGNRRVSREIPHYDLDVILAVGYRVNSKKAGDFRRWASSILRDHLEKGYSLNYTRLEEDPEALRTLAEEVRGLRSSEKGTYAILRDCFKICASDYDKNSKKANSFFSLLQNKFYHAITGSTASKIISERANAEDVNIGVISFNSEIPTIEEMLTAKNYFNNKELQELNLLSEAFLVMAESLVIRGRRMTMEGLHEKINETMRLLEYDVFSGYDDHTRARAEIDARREHANYLEILKLQMLDLDTPFNLDSFYDGEYNYLKEETARISLDQLKKNISKINVKLISIKKNISLE